MPAKRILLIEDDRDNAELFVLGLRSGGYTVDVAETAALARTRLAGVRYAVVIVDWRLPDGDGIEIADLAAATGAKTILASGYVLQMPAERVTAHEILMKPLRPSELLAAIKRAIGGPT
jgi:DNA-binding response OmpR family regulator